MKFLFGRKRQKDLADEIQSHLDMAARDRMSRGESTEDAKAAAHREFGNAAIVREVTHDQWGWAWLDNLFQDLRFGLRMLRKSPGFTAVAIVTLALGIGANTAIFSVVDALMLKDLSVKDPHELVTFSHVYLGLPGGPRYQDAFPYPEFERLRKELRILSSVSAEFNLDRSNVTINGPGGGWDDGQVSVSLVSGNYFTNLGTIPLLGRALTSEDDRNPGGHPVAVISYGYWKRRFALSPQVLGRTFTLNNTKYAILGVIVPEFSGDWVGKPTDIWIPIAMQSEVMVDRPGLLSNSGAPWVRIIGRLKPGITLQEAQAGTNVILARDQGPARSARNGVSVAPTPSFKVNSFAKGYSPQRDYFGKAFWILLAAVGLVLLIACANVASLLLTRSAARRTEITLRFALGARRGRIIRQLLTESMILSILGGISGLLLSVWGTDALLSYMSSGMQSIGVFAVQLDVHPDARLLTFSAALCVSTGLLFGMAPAIRAFRGFRTASLNGSRTASGRLAGHFRIGKTLVVSQVALSLVLLISAGLFARTLHNLKSQKMGFDHNHVLLVRTAPSQNGRVGAALANFIPMAEERIASLPGVLSVSSSELGLLGGSGGSPVTVQGHIYAPDEEKFVAWNLVAPRYFETVGMKLLTGRDFSVKDTETSQRVAIINETMARYFYGNESPVGKRFGMRGDTDFPVEIVGVVTDAKYDSLREENQKMIFIPYRQDLKHMTDLCLAIRTIGDPATVKNQIRGVLANLDRTLPVLGIETINEWVNQTLIQERLVAMLSGFFSGLTMLLACVGLYGVISYMVARRTNEIGIRMALGATRKNVLGMILQESLSLVFIGLVIGVAASLAASRLISSQLFEVGGTDPATIVGAAVLMVLVSAVAGLLPAYRASKVDPMVALRYE